ncbi:MAG: ABC transporter ATP-binding protein [Sulfobacillus sp.]
MSLTLQHVSKSFGLHPAITDVSLDIPAGTIHGLIGPNGAGKTTLMRLLLQIITPTQGTLLWNGKPLAQSVAQQFAYVPEERGLYPRATVWDQLKFFGTLWGLSPRHAHAQADYWIQRLALTPYAQVPARDLSKGNARKVQIALGLLANPSLLILDEPFDGMDPENSRIVQTVLKEKQSHGMTILISSHSLDFLAEICEGITILHHGHTLLHGNLMAIREAMPWRVLHVHYATWDAARLTAWEQRLAIHQDAQQLPFTYHIDQAQVPAIHLGDLMHIGEITQFFLNPPSLSDIYWHVLPQEAG